MINARKTAIFLSSDKMGICEYASVHKKCLVFNLELFYEKDYTSFYQTFFDVYPTFVFIDASYSLLDTILSNKDIYKFSRVILLTNDLENLELNEYVKEKNELLLSEYKANKSEYKKEFKNILITNISTLGGCVRGCKDLYTFSLPKKAVVVHKVKEFLLSIGFMLSGKSMRYIIESIGMLLENREFFINLRPTCFSLIATKYHTKPDDVMRTIIYGISSRYPIYKELWNKAFQVTLETRPSCKKFLILCADAILREMQK